MLLFELLQELIYHKDYEQLLLRVSGVGLEQTEEGFELEAQARYGLDLEPVS